jgi:hypothetical protein
MPRTGSLRAGLSPPRRGSDVGARASRGRSGRGVGRSSRASEARSVERVAAATLSRRRAQRRSHVPPPADSEFHPFPPQCNLERCRRLMHRLVCFQTCPSDPFMTRSPRSGARADTARDSACSTPCERRAFLVDGVCADPTCDATSVRRSFNARSRQPPSLSLGLLRPWRSSHGILLFRPVGQKAFAQAIRELLGRGYSVRTAVSALADAPMELSRQPWVNVLWDATSAVMITKHVPLARNLLLHWAHELPASEIEKTADAFRRLTGQRLPHRRRSTTTRVPRL